MQPGVYGSKRINSVGVLLHVAGVRDRQRANRVPKHWHLNGYLFRQEDACLPL
jgi:hypothetical protein